MSLGSRRPPAFGPAWTVRDNLKLARLIDRGLTDEQIAAQFGRTAPTSVERRRQNLGLLREEERPWAAADEQAFRDPWRAGASYREIAAEVGRDVGSMTQKRRQLGLEPRI